MIFLSKGEGFGLPPLQAMSAGLPVILSNNTGMMDFCDSRYNFPIETKQTEQSPLWWDGAVTGGKWNMPDWDAAINKLRWIYHHRERSLGIGESAAKWVRERWTFDHSAIRMIHLLNDIVDGDGTDGDFSDRITQLKDATPGDFVAAANSSDHDTLFTEVRNLCSLGNSRIINVGAGYGNIAINAARDGILVLAVEGNKRVLQRINETAEFLCVNGIQYAYSDIFELRFAGKFFNVSVSQGVLNHFDDRDVKMLVYEQLRVADKVLISVPIKHSCVGDEICRTVEEWREILPGEILKIRRYGKHLLIVLQ